MKRQAKGWELEAFDRRWRKLVVWQRGEIARHKRTARRRERREGRAQARRVED